MLRTAAATAYACSRSHSRAVVSWPRRSAWPRSCGPPSAPASRRGSCAGGARRRARWWPGCGCGRPRAAPRSTGMPDRWTSSGYSRHGRHSAARPHPGGVSRLLPPVSRRIAGWRSALGSTVGRRPRPGLGTVPDRTGLRAGRSRRRRSECSPATATRNLRIPTRRPTDCCAPIARQSFRSMRSLLRLRVPPESFRFVAG